MHSATVDFNLAHKGRPGLTVFMDVVKAFNNSPDWFSGQVKRINMSGLYGTRVNFGLSGRF